MTRLKIILLLLQFSFYSLTILAANDKGTHINWMNNFESALIKAGNENKLVLLYFSGSDWCRPCIQLKEKVFDSPEFEEFSNNNFITVQIDFPAHSDNRLPEEQQQYNEQIAEKYNSSGAFPFVVVSNINGEALAEFSGYNRESVEKYINKLQTVIDDNK